MAGRKTNRIQQMDEQDKGSGKAEDHQETPRHHARPLPAQIHGPGAHNAEQDGKGTGHTQ